MDGPGIDTAGPELVEEEDVVELDDADPELLITTLRLFGTAVLVAVPWRRKHCAHPMVVL